MKDYLGLGTALVALILAFGLLTDHFLTITTLKTVASQIPAAVVLASGMTLVLILGGIDLSVGAVLALSSTVLGVCLVSWQLPLGVAVAACLATGLACGIANGLVIIAWRVPAFIATLGMMEVARGCAYGVAHSQTQYLGSALDAVADGGALGVSPSIILAFVVVIMCQLVLSRTVFGRYIVAIGTNEEAVRLSGVEPAATKLAVYAMAGLFSAVASMLHASRLAAADPNAGMGAELQAIAAVVIGGTSLMGGRGSLVRSLIGVLIIAVLASGLAQVGAQEPTKRLVTGSVIVVAAILDAYRYRGSRAGRA